MVGNDGARDAPRKEALPIERGRDSITIYVRTYKQAILGRE